MILLTFAHRGEARAFLETKPFSPVTFFFDGLHRTDSEFLLITGEGPQVASEKTMAVLTAFHSEIDLVINLGVAGSLSHKFKRFDLLWIRTSYAHHAERLEFKSYTTASLHLKAKDDCMTVFSRVITLEDKNKLAQFANIVDRELWAIASAAQVLKKPFRSLKIISDDLNMSTEHSQQNFCQLVKEDALIYSQALLNEYNEEFSLSMSEKNNPNIINSSFTLFEQLIKNPLYYFTSSQERKLQSLIKSLNLLGVETDKINFDIFLEIDKLPKERTKILLQHLNDLLNPFAKKIREALKESLSPLEAASISTSYDSDFEQEWLQLSMKIQSSRDLEKIKNALKIFSYEDFKNVLNGKIDV